MSLLKFVFSKTFFKHIGLAIVALVALIFLIMQWLRVSTNHGDYITVPDLSKKLLNEVEQILDSASLGFVVLDSTNYNPKFPRFSVIEQNPVAGDKVKEDRKIYLTINPSGYRKVTVPKIIQVTLRNAESIIKAVGLEVGNIIYVDDIGKDMVLSIKHEGKEIKPGDMLTKTSKIDLVCGNGRRPGSVQENDTIGRENQIENEAENNGAN